jgi:phosphoribosylanthranilate isomerase
MSIWVKICGNTSLADAQLAVDAGADAVGFVFAPSPRRVTPHQVAAISPHLSPSTEKIGVFVNADFAAISSTVEQCGLTGVQLHFDGVGSLSAQLRERFGPGLRLLRVIHFDEDAVRQLQSACTDSNIDGVLVDSRTATAVGGTGVAFDWQAARDTIFTGENKLKLIAAGGLIPGNVAHAIATLHPWGVDVSSGVELSPGVKDAEKVRNFVAAAKNASVIG